MFQSVSKEYIYYLVPDFLSTLMSANIISLTTFSITLIQRSAITTIMILIVEASLVYFVNASDGVARQVILSIPCAAMVSDEAFRQVLRTFLKKSLEPEFRI